MAKTKAQTVGLDEYATESTQWSRDRETGHYWKITQKYVTNTTDGITRKEGDPVKSKNPYRVATEKDHDHVMSYTGLDGKPGKLYLKEIKSR